MSAPKRPYKKYSSGLVLDGEIIKQRLMADRLETGQLVHVDWLRFTCYSKNLPPPDEAMLPPAIESDFARYIKSFGLSGGLACEHGSGVVSSFGPLDAYRGDFERRFLSSAGFSARSHTGKNADEYECLALDQGIDPLDIRPRYIAGQALALAYEVVEILGPGFSVEPIADRGHDYYASRYKIMSADKEVAWVGFGVKPRKTKNKGSDIQAQGVHVNLFGAACTFAKSFWYLDMARLLERYTGKITRIDYALDFFDGYQGGIERVMADYELGLCNVYGKKPSCNMVGDFINDQSRSFYIGSKLTGKQTNVYEKGDQLFGPEAGSDWIRFELRYGDKQRVIPPNALSHPSDFFRCASDWHASVLREATEIAALDLVDGELHTTPRLKDTTAEAAAYRVLSWFIESAAPALSVIKGHLDPQVFDDLMRTNRKPHRLDGFAVSTYKQAFESAAIRFSNAQDLAIPGTALTLA